MSYRHFTLSYTDWKTLQTALSANVYYETFETRYKSIVIDITRENVYFAEIDRFIPNADLTDFETNVQPGATSVENVDKAVSLEIPLAVVGGAGPTDTDDDAVDGGQAAALGISLNYGWDGVDWGRINQTGGSMDVNITSPIPIDVDLSQVDDSVLIYGQDSGVVNRAIRTNTLGQVETSVIASVLPTGAATQVTLDTLLTEATFTAEDFASETTLALINEKITAVDTGNVTIGASLPAGANNIGDVDVASLPVAAGGTETLVRIAFGSVPVAYGAGAQLVTTAVRNHLLVRNDTDGDILLSLDGATDNFKILANEVGSFDGVTIASAATVRIKQDAGAPASGEVTISAWSDR